MCKLRAKKWIYICDHCGKAEIGGKYNYSLGAFEAAPKGWYKLGREDLCPECYEIYLKFKNEVKNKEVKNKKEDILTKNCTFRKDWLCSN